MDGFPTSYLAERQRMLRLTMSRMMMARTSACLSLSSRFTNGVILRPVLGIDNQTPLPGFSTHNEDIARLHVEALHPHIPAGNYQAITNGTSGIRWEETNEIVVRELPDTVQSGSLLNSGSSMTVPVHLDASETERTFGWKFQRYESQVLSVVG
jgi:hypothetical protein